MNAPTILCATQRLARRLRLAAAEGAWVGAVPQALTVAQWLERTIEAAFLGGELAADAMPARVLSDFQERLLWKQVIGKSVRGRDDAPLLSLDGLAASAQEANALVETWRLALPPPVTEEQRQFADWRRRFRRLCEERRWHETSRHLAWQVDCIASGAGVLPAQVERAGFDRFNPQEQRLFEALEARGTSLADRPSSNPGVSPAGCFAYPDAASQFLAMARWVGERLAESPDTRIGLVLPDLERHRGALCRALDGVLDPAALLPAAAQAQRIYNLSLGQGLARVAPVSTALSLLRLGLSARRVEQVEVGRLILGPGWSADQREADARASFEARCRRKLPATTRLASITRLAQRWRDDGAPIGRLCADLERLVGWGARVGGRRSFSAWATEFRGLLEAVGWPGERSLSSHDFQAREAFFGQLAALAGLDPILGETTANDALATLQDACSRQLFQAETEGRPRVEVLGALEAAGESFDALWVANLTDDVWPPPPRPNPLLPAELQRSRGCPNASPEVQRKFAGGVFRRFFEVAPRVVLSWPQAEGERGLRRSPLVPPDGAGTNDAEELAQPAEPLAERLRCEAGDAMESFPDFMAPPVADATQLAGGTWLLRAQAICPAWAFYQFRLGAEEVETPSDGLDSRARGTLLHAVLEAFWTSRDSATVREWSPEARRDEVRTAVVAALAAHDAANPAAPLPPRLRALEAARLEALVGAWVEFELARPGEFSVVACEEEHELVIEGIAARVTVDRIDALPDGRRVVIDYKTGATVDAKSWSADRIVDPQLPIYATWAVAPAPLAAIAFAQIRSDKMRFVGVAESADLLPKVEALAASRKVFDEQHFPDWPAVLAHWRQAVSAVAAEISAGDARVAFDNEKLLEHCPVKPLLRLAERRLQSEAGQ